jgi:ribosome-associated protein
VLTGPADSCTLPRLLPMNAEVTDQRPSRRQAARAALALDDETLLAQSQVSVFIGSGPGGQHRNKTASAVRLVHPATGVSVTATERRSQAQNRSVALGRLRKALRQLTVVPKPRRPTRPSRAAKERRLQAKKHLGKRKTERRRPEGW